MTTPGEILWRGDLSLEEPGGGNSSAEQRKYPVTILHRESARTGENPFNWEGLTCVRLIKLPKKILKTNTDSGENLKKLIQKFTASSQIVDIKSSDDSVELYDLLSFGYLCPDNKSMTRLVVKGRAKDNEFVGFCVSFCAPIKQTGDGVGEDLSNARELNEHFDSVLSRHSELNPRGENDVEDSPLKSTASSPSKSGSSSMVGEIQSSSEPDLASHHQHLGSPEPSGLISSEEVRETHPAEMEDQSHLENPPPSVMILSENLVGPESEAQDQNMDQSHLDEPPPSVQIIQENLVRNEPGQTDSKEDQSHLDNPPPSVMILSENIVGPESDQPDQSHLDEPPASVQIVSEIRSRDEARNDSHPPGLQLVSEATLLAQSSPLAPASYLEEMPPTPAVSPPRSDLEVELMPPSPAPAAIQGGLRTELNGLFEGQEEAEQGQHLVVEQIEEVRQRRIIYRQPSMPIYHRVDTFSSQHQVPQPQQQQMMLQNPRQLPFQQNQMLAMQPQQRLNQNQHRLMNAQREEQYRQQQQLQQQLMSQQQQQLHNHQQPQQHQQQHHQQRHQQQQPHRQHQQQQHPQQLQLQQQSLNLQQQFQQQTQQQQGQLQQFIGPRGQFQVNSGGTGQMYQPMFPIQNVPVGVARMIGPGATITNLGPQRLNTTSEPQARPMGPPTSQMIPPNRFMRPPAGQMIHQNRPMAPPSRPMGPPSRPIGPPSRPMAPPNRPMGPQSRPIAPPNRPMGPPTGQMLPQNRPIGPPSGQMIPMGSVPRMSTCNTEITGRQGGPYFHQNIRVPSPPKPIQPKPSTSSTQQSFQSAEISSTSDQVISSLSEIERSHCESLLVFLQEIWAHGSSRLKEKVQWFLNGSDQSLLEICREFPHNFTINNKVIHAVRKSYSSRSPSAVGSSGLEQLELEENVIQENNETKARLALQALQSFLDKTKQDQLEAVKHLILELLRTNIGVRTFSERTGFNFVMDKKILSGNQAQEYLVETFPALRQMIILRKFNIGLFHRIFSNIKLNVLSLNEVELKMDEATRFEDKIAGIIRTDDLFLLLHQILSKTACLADLEHLYPQTISREEVRQLRIGFHHYKVAVRNGRIDPKTLIDKVRYSRAAQQEGTLQISVPQDPDPQESSMQNSVPHDAGLHSSVPHDASLQSSVPQDASLQSSVPQDISFQISVPSVPSVRISVKSSDDISPPASDTISQKVTKKRGRPFGSKNKPKDAEATSGPGTQTGPEVAGSRADLRTPPPVTLEPAPTAQPPPPPQHSVSEAASRKNKVYNIFSKKLLKETTTRLGQITPHFISLINTEMELDSFLKETNLIDSQARSNESNMKTLMYAFPEFLTLLRDQVIVPRDLHWSFENISYDSDQGKFVTKSTTRKPSTYQVPERIPSPPPITERPTEEEQPGSVSLDYRLQASWQVEAFGKTRVLVAIFTSSHIIFSPESTVRLPTDLPVGSVLRHKFFPDRKTGKVWFPDRLSPGTDSESFFQRMESLDDFVEIFLNKQGVSEKTVLVERGGFQELTVLYEMTTGSEYTVKPGQMFPIRELQNEDNLCYSFLKDTFGIPQEGVEYRGNVSGRNTNSIQDIAVHGFFQNMFGILTSEFLVFFPTDKECRFFKDTIYLGEEIQVKICKINQRLRLKLISPFPSKALPYQLCMRASQLSHATILEKSDARYQSVLGMLRENIAVAIPRSDWTHLFASMDTSSMFINVDRDVAKVWLKVDCLAKYQINKGKQFYAFYLKETLSVEEANLFKLQDSELRQRVFIVPCKDSEENPVDLYDLETGVYIEKIQGGELHAVNLIKKVQQQNSLPESKTEKVRLRDQPKYIYHAHIDGEAMLTIVESFNQAIAHRVVQWTCLYGVGDVQHYRQPFDKFISSHENYSKTKKENKAANQTDNSVTKINQPAFLKPVFHIRAANSRTSEPPSVLKKEVLWRIDLKFAPRERLMKIPGVDEELAKVIIRERRKSETLSVFMERTLHTVFSAQNGIQFDVGPLGRNVMKLKFNREILSKHSKNQIKVKTRKEMPVIPLNPLTQNSGMIDLISKLKSKDSTNATQGGEDDSPSVTQGEEEDSPSVTQGEEEDSPNVTQGEEEDSLNVTQGEEGDSPSVTQGEEDDSTNVPHGDKEPSVSSFSQSLVSSGVFTENHARAEDEEVSEEEMPHLTPEIPDTLREDVTKMPNITESEDVTQMPNITESEDVTQMPNITESEDVTKMPNISVIPDDAEKKDVTGATEGNNVVDEQTDSVPEDKLDKEDHDTTEKQSEIMENLASAEPFENPESFETPESFLNSDIESPEGLENPELLENHEAIESPKVVRLEDPEVKEKTEIQTEEMDHEGKQEEIANVEIFNIPFTSVVVRPEGAKPMDGDNESQDLRNLSESSRHDLGNENSSERDEAQQPPWINQGTVEEDVNSSIVLETCPVSDENSMLSDISSDENEGPIIRSPQNRLIEETSDISSDEEEESTEAPRNTLLEEISSNSNCGIYSDISSDVEPILERVISPVPESIDKTKVVPPISLKHLRTKKIHSSSKRRKGGSDENKENDEVSEDSCDSQFKPKRRKKAKKKQKRQKESQSDRGHKRDRSESSQQPARKRKLSEHQPISSVVNPESHSLEPEPSIAIAEPRQESVPNPLPDHEQSDGSQEGESTRKVKKKKTVEVLVLKKKIETKPPAGPKSGLVKLTERLFSGQYIKLNKLSSRTIEEQIGCSLSQYFGKITISEALQSDSFPSVQLTPAEMEMLQLLERDRAPSERIERRLKCTFCQLEFKDYEERVQHYLLHTSGELPIPKVSPTFPCALCPAVFSSVKERQEHYLTTHCPVEERQEFPPPSTSTSDSGTKRISCRHSSCSMEFESKAQMTSHFLLIHKLKDPTFIPSPPKRTPNNRTLNQLPG